MSDYSIDISKEKIHWWDFNSYLNGLTDKCILDRVREIRTTSPSEIKDNKERDKLVKLQKRWALRRTLKENNLTDEQEQSMNELNKIIFGKEK